MFPCEPPYRRRHAARRGRTSGRRSVPILGSCRYGVAVRGRWARATVSRWRGEASVGRQPVGRHTVTGRASNGRTINGRTVARRTIARRNTRRRRNCRHRRRRGCYRRNRRRRRLRTRHTLLDDRDRRTGRHRIARLDDDLRNHAAHGRRHLGVHLIRRDLDERFILLDGVADFFEPLRDRSLGNRFTELRHRNRGRHRLEPYHFAHRIRHALDRDHEFFFER